jgi:hypothetical protein
MIKGEHLMRTIEEIYEDIIDEKSKSSMSIEFPPAEKSKILKILDAAQIPYEIGVSKNNDLITLDIDDWDIIKQDMKKIRYNYVN